MRSKSAGPEHFFHGVGHQLKESLKVFKTIDLLEVKMLQILNHHHATLALVEPGNQYFVGSKGLVGLKQFVKKIEMLSQSEILGPQGGPQHGDGDVGFGQEMVQQGTHPTALITNNGHRNKTILLPVGPGLLQFPSSFSRFTKKRVSLVGVS